MTVEQFKRFDKKLVDKVGRERIGRTGWRRLSLENKLKKAYAVVTSPEVIRDVLAESNFDKFMKVLTRLVGTTTAQSRLLGHKLAYTLSSMSIDGDLVSTIRAIYSQSKALETQEDSVSSELLSETFWKLYDACKERAFEELTDPIKVDCLLVPFNALTAFYKFVIELEKPEERKKIVAALKSLVRRQVGSVINELSRQRRAVALGTPEDVASAWQKLSLFEWTEILGSIMLASCDTTFCFDFGREKMLLERLLAQCHTSPATVVDTQFKCPSMGCSGMLDFNRRCPSCCRLSYPKDALSDKCPREVCGGILLWSAYCSSCVSQRHSCQQTMILSHATWCCSDCGRSLTVTSEECRKCAVVWNPLDTAVNNECHVCILCDLPLDFNRFCRHCSVYYVQGKKCICGRVTTKRNVDGRWKCSCGKSFMEYPKDVNVGTTAQQFKDDQIVPLHPKVFQAAVKVPVPDSLADPKHYGHLAWKYCQFVADIKP